LHEDALLVGAAAVCVAVGWTLGVLVTLVPTLAATKTELFSHYQTVHFAVLSIEIRVETKVFASFFRENFRFSQQN
jgi:hypothetical protein